MKKWLISSKLFITCKCMINFPLCPEAAGVSHDSQRAQTCTFEPWRFKTPQNSTRRPPERDKKSENGSGEGKKSAKFWASHPSAPPPFNLPPTHPPTRPSGPTMTHTKIQNWIGQNWIWPILDLAKTKMAKNGLAKTGLAKVGPFRRDTRKGTKRGIEKRRENNQPLIMDGMRMT